MEIKEKSCQVEIFGHYGNNNLGDEAIIKATMQQLRSRIPNLELIGLSINPTDTRKRYNIESYSIRTGTSQSKSTTNNYTDGNNVKVTQSNLLYGIKGRLVASLDKTSALFGFFRLLINLKSEFNYLRNAKKILSDMQALIICGSNQLIDKSGPWGFPYTIMKWTLLARLTQTKVFVVSVGAGPLTHPVSYWMFKRLLKYAAYVSYRDNGSKQLIERHIADVNGFVYPDLANSLVLSGKGVQKI